MWLSKESDMNMVIGIKYLKSRPRLGVAVIIAAYWSNRAGVIGYFA